MKEIAVQILNKEFDFPGDAGLDPLTGGSPNHLRAGLRFANGGRRRADFTLCERPGSRAF